MSTLKIPVIHNGSVREAVVEEGRGRILVIDGASCGAREGMACTWLLLPAVSWHVGHKLQHKPSPG